MFKVDIGAQGPMISELLVLMVVWRMSLRGRNDNFGAGVNPGWHFYYINQSFGNIHISGTEVHCSGVQDGVWGRDLYTLSQQVHSSL